MLRLRWILLFILLAALVAFGVFFISAKFEGEAPSVSISPEPGILGKRATYVLNFEDNRSGLREIRVELIQGERAVSLVHEAYPSRVKRTEKTIQIDAKALELSDGDARLRVEARDFSWRHGGNLRLVVAPVKIDTTPPALTVISRFHYVNQGGSGLIAYRASEKLVRSGVAVGKRWFPGFPYGGHGYIAVFAVAHDAPPDTRISLIAEDQAGNRSHTAFHYRIKPKRFRTDTIRLTDGFLGRVMPYFMDRDAGLKGDLIEVFLKVNRRLRNANEERIRQLCAETAGEPLWIGRFLPMERAKTMARFADHRIYLYRGKEVDRQLHMGLDFASLAMSPVKAANAGRVVFAGEMGIYGNMVLMDHGCGLFSMYGHLSRIDVESGQRVEKGRQLGVTGSTGLAGGDHLHFAMLVSGLYVNPVEWMDPHWVQDNIDSKLALFRTGE